jgi:hypothetical protein
MAEHEAQRGKEQLYHLNVAVAPGGETVPFVRVLPSWGMPLIGFIPVSGINAAETDGMRTRAARKSMSISGTCRTLVGGLVKPNNALRFMVSTAQLYKINLSLLLYISTP